MPADDAVLGRVRGGVRIGNALELADPDQPVEGPGRVATRDGSGDAVGGDVGSNAVEVG